MSNNKQTAVEWLVEQLGGNGYISTYESIKRDELQSIINQAKEMEKQQKDNLPIHIHEGIENTWVYIEDGIVHVKPNPKQNEQQ